MFTGFLGIHHFHKFQAEKTVNCRTVPAAAATNQNVGNKRYFLAAGSSVILYQEILNALASSYASAVDLPDCEDFSGLGISREGNLFGLRLF